MVAGAEELTDEAAALEELYLGLRTRDGLPSRRLPPDTAAAWRLAGWAEPEPDGRVRLTPEGWLRLDALVASADSAYGADPAMPAQESGAERGQPE